MNAPAIFKKHRRLVAVALFLLVLFLVMELAGIRENLSLDYIRAVLVEHAVWGAILFVLLFTVANLVQIPGWIFCAAAVLTLGKLAGGVLTYVAAVVSCLVTYGVIHRLGGDALRELDGPVAAKIFRYMDRYPLACVVVLRIIFQTAPPLNYSLSLAGVRFRHYVIGSILGLPLPIAVYCLAFDLLFHELS